MADFQKRVTQQTARGNGFFREEFLLDFSLQTDAGLLGFWGIGNGWWKDCYIGSSAHQQNYSLELIQEGVFELYNLDHKTSILLKPDDLFFLGPGYRKQLKAAPEGRKSCIFFSNTPVITAALNRIFQGKDSLTLPHVLNISQDFQNIHQCAAANAPKTENLIFAMLEKLAANTPGAQYPEALNVILNLMKNPASLKLSRQDLAASAGIGISTLNRLFEQYLQTSPGRYRRARRLELACRLLALKSMPLKKIAAECGFSSLPFFCREFKNMTGSTPSEYIAGLPPKKTDGQPI